MLVHVGHLSFLRPWCLTKKKNLQYAQLIQWAPITVRVCSVLAKMVLNQWQMKDNEQRVKWFWKKKRQFITHPEWNYLAILDVEASGVPLIYSPPMCGLTVLLNTLANAIAPFFSKQMLENPCSLVTKRLILIQLTHSLTGWQKGTFNNDVTTRYSSTL